MSPCKRAASCGLAASDAAFALLAVSKKLIIGSPDADEVVGDLCAISAVLKKLRTGSGAADAATKVVRGTGFAVLAPVAAAEVRTGLALEGVILAPVPVVPLNPAMSQIIASNSR